MILRKSEVIKLNKQIEIVKEIIQEIIKKEELKIEDIFSYGDRKIEFMVYYGVFVISISVVDDLSYDFTAFNDTGNKIVYSNSKVIVDIDDVYSILMNDIKKSKEILI